MILKSQKSPETLDPNERKTLHRCRATLGFLIEPFLRVLKSVQRRSHEILIKRVSEEGMALRESQSMAVIARRPGISEESLALAEKRKRLPSGTNPSSSSMMKSIFD